MLFPFAVGLENDYPNYFQNGHFFGFFKNQRKVVEQEKCVLVSLHERVVGCPALEVVHARFPSHGFP